MGEFGVRKNEGGDPAEFHRHPGCAADERERNDAKENARSVSLLQFKKKPRNNANEWNGKK